MAEPPDLEDLARRYLDLWQEQWVAMAADPHAAEAISRFSGLIGQQMAAMGPMAQAFFAALPAAGAPFASGGWPPRPQDSHDRAAPTAATPPGSATAGGAPGNRPGDVDELTRRLAAVEERLAKLEAKRPTRRSAPRAKRNKP